jgi:hypothetical protein
MITREKITEELLGKVGTWHGEDTLWWIHIMRSGTAALGVMHPLLLYRNTQDSLSKRYVHHYQAVWKLYREEFRLSVLLVSMSFLSLIVNVAFRRIRCRVCSFLRGSSEINQVYN